MNLLGMDAVPGSRGNPPRGPDLSAPPRLRLADRQQSAIRICTLDDLLAADHDARVVWQVVDGLNMTPFEDKIAARGSEPGRAATDPRILLSLWLYATIHAVGSARELAILCEEHDAYRWICGDVSLNYHTISDFRVEHTEALNQVFVEIIAVLVQQGLVTVERISQDGLRVRADAGTASFRREETLQELEQDARDHLAALQKQNDPAWTAKQLAKRKADAEDRCDRLHHALQQLTELQATREKSTRRYDGPQQELRVSTTDPEARKMKMADGGFRPAYNVQLAVDTGCRAIVGADVTNSGRDNGQSEPMREQVERNTGKKVGEHLYDGGFVNLEEIDRAEKAGVHIYAPVSKQSKNPHERKRDDTDDIFRWRQRMAGDEAKTIYRMRASTAETVNADLTEHRGLRRLPVRGSPKVKAVVLLCVLAYNLVLFATELTAARQKC